MDDASAHQLPRSREAKIRLFLGRFKLIRGLVSRVQVAWDNYQKVDPQVNGVARRSNAQANRMTGKAKWFEDFQQALIAAYREYEVDIMAGELFLASARAEFERRAAQPSADLIAALQLRGEKERLVDFELTLDRMRQARLDSAKDILFAQEGEEAARKLAKMYLHIVTYSIPEWRRAIAMGLNFHDVSIGQEMMGKILDYDRTLRQGTAQIMVDTTRAKQELMRKMYGNVQDAQALYDQVITAVEEDLKSTSELESQIEQAEPQRLEFIRRMKAALESVKGTSATPPAAELPELPALPSSTVTDLTPPTTPS